MKVFLSWSGEYSRHIAIALEQWLPQVVNEIEPFVSDSIDAGARWQAEVASQLEESKFGIVIVTAENQSRPWLNFEAGAIAKAVSNSRLVPLAVDLRPSDIELPLGQFQAQPMTIEGLKKILLSVNSILDKPLRREQLEQALDVWWPRLEEQIKKVPRDSNKNTAAESIRSEQDMLSEILASVRQLVRAGAQSRFKDPRLDEYDDTVDLARRLTRMAKEMGITLRITWNRDTLTVHSDVPLPLEITDYAGIEGQKRGLMVVIDDGR